VISKGLGYGIILGSLAGLSKSTLLAFLSLFLLELVLVWALIIFIVRYAVKIPQILKLFSSKSGAGIAIAGVTLELLAITFSAVYSFVNGYPFR
jgi:hypothetical protein